MKVGALCAGYGGLELGLLLAGVPVELSWYAEIDKFASKVMAHNHPGVPNLGDLTAIEDCDPVDIVTAGFPCQPVSVSGSRKGHDDERWLIRDVVSVWRRSNAQWLILENVPGLLSANDGEAFGQVVDSLAEAGCIAEWTHLRADAVGAPHIRERWFCVARTPDADRVGFEGWVSGSRASELSEVERGAVDHADVGETSSDSSGLGRLRVGPEHREQGKIGESELEDQDRIAPDTDQSRLEGEDFDESERTDAARRRRSFAADTIGVTSERLGGPGEVEGSTRQARGEGRTHPLGDAPGSGGETASDTHGPGLERIETVDSSDSGLDIAHGDDADGCGSVDFGEYGAAVERWEYLTGRPAPSALDDRGRLNVPFVEWMMGLEPGWVTEVDLSRKQKLKILGNGVVPQQAAAAVAHLIQGEAQ